MVVVVVVVIVVVVMVVLGMVVAVVVFAESLKQKETTQPNKYQNANSTN
jgi:flagellar basal body-associated protein FliL